MAGFTEDDLIVAVRTVLGGDAPGVVLGVGDDAALVEFGGHLGILTTDMMVEGVHFELDDISPRDLGHKALTVSVSDVAAMGGSPRYALVTLGLASNVGLPWVVELYGGLREAAIDYGVAVVGGDTSRADRIMLSVAVTGEVARTGVITRSGARPGDRIVVTGTLGGAAGGLALARSGHRGAVATDWGRELLAAHDRPVARVGEGQALARSGATAMMDISDGLAKDLSRLCAESRVGAAVALSSIPVAPALEGLCADMGADPLQLALGGGEDYELLATVPPEAVEPAAAQLRRRFGTRLTDVGEIRADEGPARLVEEGTGAPLEAVGWDHFGA